MSAPLVTPSRDTLVGAIADSEPVCEHRLYGQCSDCLADALIASGAVIDAATLADDETIRAVAYKYAEGEATYAASGVRYVLGALVDVLAERGEQHG
jgi:hypothetical protein